MLQGGRLMDVPLSLQGAVPAAVLALLVQGGFDLLERIGEGAMGEVWAARDPVLMASAMKKAIEAGREAYRAGRMPRTAYAAASSPIDGTFF